MLEASHVVYDASWFVAILIFALVSVLVMQFLPDPMEVDGPNRAARSALAVIALAAAIAFLSHGQADSESTQGKIEFFLWVVTILCVLAGIVLSWVGAVRVRRQGDRLVAAMALTLTLAPTVAVLVSLVVCLLTGCVFWGT